MRVVFDTNVILSGFLTATGISQYVFSLALKRHTVILSEHILKELTKNLSVKLAVPPSKIRRLVDFLRRRTLIYEVPPNPKIQFPDKTDLPLLSLVEQAQAHYFVTGDRELLKLKKIGTTLVLNPREALEVL